GVCCGAAVDAAPAAAGLQPTQGNVRAAAAVEAFRFDPGALGLEFFLWRGCTRPARRRGYSQLREMSGPQPRSKLFDLILVPWDWDFFCGGGGRGGGRGGGGGL